MGTVAHFIFLGSKINTDSGCSHKIKRHLLFGRIAMTNLDSVLKSRDITVPTKLYIFKAMILVFWMLSFKPTFSLSSFTFIKRFFSSFSLSTIMFYSKRHSLTQDSLEQCDRRYRFYFNVCICCHTWIKWCFIQQHSWVSSLSCKIFCYKDYFSDDYFSLQNFMKFIY